MRTFTASDIMKWTDISINERGAAIFKTQKIESTRNSQYLNIYKKPKKKTK